MLQLLVTAKVVHSSLIIFILIMDLVPSSETLVLSGPTIRHIPEYYILRKVLCCDTFNKAPKYQNDRILLAVNRAARWGLV
jgi:hypothetical protein